MNIEYKILTGEEARGKFIDIFDEFIIPERHGADRLLQWLDNETDFFKAPASTRFHGAFESGLCNHSLAVYEHLVFLNQAYGFGFAQDTMALCALCHDLCKCNTYKVSSRNVKNDKTGQWEKVPFFAFEEQEPYGSHGPKSVFLVQRFVPLSFEEASAIACHMGFSDQANMNSVAAVFEKNELAWALHVADEAASWRSNI
ncbi:HD domain-containing protein [Candidatus Allofournierella merdipullorum]|uniref:HD domain-containing protein n=1 Tax=Candidatus Allofournierella merdipullorum TaxID=2838595 RepID=UPI00374F25EF